MTTAVRLFRAMGSTVSLQIHGDPELLERAEDRVHELEARWSRFLPDSEISRCNATRGLPVFVSADTRRLVRHGVEAWRLTDGACDPSVLDALIAAGYDRTFTALRTAPSARPSTETPIVPGCEGIEIDDGLGSVTLPVGAGFDPGAIGKGLAADIITEELIDAGANGAFVSVGGDLRAIGVSENGDGWEIPIHEPSIEPHPFGAVAITEGAVATSTDRRRVWRRRGVEFHHVIDPRTGTPSNGDAALVTVLSGAAWWAEALATQLMLAPRDKWSEIVAGDGAFIVDRAGDHIVLGSMVDHYRTATRT